jgi:hypothetical protein
VGAGIQHVAAADPGIVAHGDRPVEEVEVADLDIDGEHAAGGDDVAPPDLDLRRIELRRRVDQVRELEPVSQGEVARDGRGLRGRVPDPDDDIRLERARQEPLVVPDDAPEPEVTARLGR